jgi:phosphoglycerate kinase
MTGFKTLNDIPEIKGKKIILRVDFNVPIENGKVMDPYRIEKSLPTINFLRNKGARLLIISHLDEKSGTTLAPVAEYLGHNFPVKFSGDFFGEASLNAITEIHEGEVILFENLRNNEGEESNDQAFAKNLASLGEIYVNDAFSVSHREHASIVGLPKFLPSYAGLQMEAEIKNLSEMFNPPHPFLFILGGAKFDTKLPLIQKFLTLADHVFVGGALANNFFKEEGLNVGKSLVTEGDFHIREELADHKLILPPDVTVLVDGKKVVKATNKVEDDESILDAGPETVQLLKDLMPELKCVLWNGPLGNYEKGFTEPTIELGKILASSDVKSIVGGGDTLAAISASGVEEKISFVSTGGGAMLQFLLDETLPGIEALKEQK